MKNISLYIHIPFCDQKCYYCDFPSFAGKGGLKNKYLKALVKEIDEKLVNNKYIIDTIFVGGGTPSSLSADELEILLSKVSTLNFAQNIEYTVECNPGSITKDKLIVMKKYGVNRLSMGLQAIQNTLLRDIGRIHSFEVFKENFLLARECGFNNINVDLMFGLPSQKLLEWEESLKGISELNPEHISAYSLIIEEGTPFDRMYEENKIKLPDEDIERDMYHSAKNILESYGFNQYEISNYAKKDFECRHNIAYWEMKDWIGVGSAASSYIEGTRITNVYEIEEYIKRSENNQNLAIEENKNSENENIEEFMFMGLRMIKGIDEDEFLRRFKKPVSDFYAEIIERYIKQDLLVKENKRLFLSEKGIEYSNKVMSDFLLEF